METLKYKGQDVQFAGETFVMPDLPYIAYEEYDAFEKITNIVTAMAKMESGLMSNPLKKEVFADARLLVFLAIKRNYPDLSEEVFLDMINPGSILIALRKLIDRELEIQGMIKQVAEKNEKKQETPAKKTTPAKK